MSEWRQALALLGALTLARVALIPLFDLTPQEAYYHLYAENLSLSYYDHPPVAGWLIYLSTLAFGKTVWGVRVVALLGGLGLQLAFYRLVVLLLPRSRRVPAFVLFVTTPLATGLSLMACPDVPLALFWALALVALATAIFRQRPRSWLWAGVAMGLAFDSKYTGILLQAGLLLFLVLSRRHRHWLRTPWPWASFALAQTIALPVYIWNVQHGFASFQFQIAGRFESGVRFDPVTIPSLALTQSVLVGPFLFFAFLAATWQELRRRPRAGGGEGERSLFLLAFSTPLLLICLSASMLLWVKINWLLPAYVAGTALTAVWCGRRLLRWHLVWAILFHVFLVVELVFYPWPVQGDDTWYGWRQLGQQVERLSADYPGAFLFSTDSYKTAAELMFYTDLKVYGLNIIGYDALQLDYLGDDLSALAGRDALLVDSQRARGSYLREVRSSFTEVRELEPIAIRRHGEVVRRYRVFFCSGYLKPPSALPSTS